jgi:hypothetical protein
MPTSTRRKWGLVFLFIVALIGGFLIFYALDLFSPANRTRKQTLANTQEIHQLSTFTILDQLSEESVNLDGCYINQETLRIGSTISMEESVPLFINSVEEFGWNRLPVNTAPYIYYFEREAGEILVLYTEKYGPYEWLKHHTDTTTYSAYLYVVIANGATYSGPCGHF